MKIELSKYNVDIKDELTWGDSEKIQLSIQKGAKIKGNVSSANNSAFEFDADALLESKYITLEITVLEVENKETKEKNPFTREWVNALSVKDGNKLYEAVQEVTKNE